LFSFPGLSEIIRGQTIKSLAILVINGTIKERRINDFVKELHKFPIVTCIFYNKDDFFDYVLGSLEGSLETNSMVFARPDELVAEIQERNLAHRLALYFFYWGLKRIDSVHNWNLEEPLRAVIISNPRSKVFRVYYNQATSRKDGVLTFVNWYDGTGQGLYREPLLNNSREIYKDFGGRVFYVPVIHVRLSVRIWNIGKFRPILILKVLRF
jgi:hypothetical protein